MKKSLALCGRQITGILTILQGTTVKKSQQNKKEPLASAIILRDYKDNRIMIKKY
jgi:hypothetical protein